MCVSYLYIYIHGTSCMTSCFFTFPGVFYVDCPLSTPMFISNAVEAREIASCGARCLVDGVMAHLCKCSSVVSCWARVLCLLDLS